MEVALTQAERRPLVTMHDLDALVKPLDDIPDCDQLVREISAMPARQVVEEVKTRWPQLNRDAWAFALLVERMGRERLYRPYHSLSEWARAELKRESWVISKNRSAAEYVLSLDPDDRTAVMRHTPPITLVEAGLHELAQHDPREALRLATLGLTQRELKRAVHASLAGNRNYEPGGFRTLHKVITEPAYQRVQAALHLARFLCQTKHPSDSDLLEAIVVEFASSIQLSPELLERFPRAAIEAGQCACIDCGATGGANLEGHHVLRKSLGLRGIEDGPQVWLCSDCHEKVTHYADGAGWRERLKEWMTRPDLEWLKTAVERQLNGRSLDSL